MKTKLSSTGQVVLPGPIRRKLGLNAGDSLNVAIREGGVILVPESKRVRKAWIAIDPVTKLPVLTLGPDSPRLTGKQVREALDEFP